MTTLRISISRKTHHSPENSRSHAGKVGKASESEFITLSNFISKAIKQLGCQIYLFLFCLSIYSSSSDFLKKYLILLFFKSKVGTCASLSLSSGRQNWEGDNEVSGSSSPGFQQAERASLQASERTAPWEVIGQGANHMPPLSSPVHLTSSLHTSVFSSTQGKNRKHHSGY